MFTTASIFDNGTFALLIGNGDPANNSYTPTSTAGTIVFLNASVRDSSNPNPPALHLWDSVNSVWN